MKAQSEREFLPEGAIVMMDSLAGRKLADIIPSLNEGVEAVSPCRRLFVSQPGLEPILRARAEQAGATVLEGHEVVGVDQDDDGVTVSVRDDERRSTAVAARLATSSPPTGPTAWCASCSARPSRAAGCSRTA